MNTQFNRRHLLRGSGALIALPALESIGFRRFASAAETAPATPPIAARETRWLPVSGLVVQAVVPVIASTAALAIRGGENLIGLLL